MPTLGWLEAARIIVISATMVYASYRDWVAREVDDEVWFLGGGVGAALTMLDLAISWSMAKLLLTLISIGVAGGTAFAFYYFGLYGGADAKAVIVISISLPLYRPVIGFHPFTGLASLSNGLLISLILPLSILLYNLTAAARGVKLFRGFEHESAWRKLAAILLGVRLSKVGERKYWFSMEEERGGKRYFKFDLFSVELEEAGVGDDRWATPGIPLLVFITAGFMLFVVYGDIISMVASALFHLW